MNVSAIFAITAVFTVCLAGGIAVGFLLAWHIYLVATNQTTGKEYAHAEIHVNCVDPYYTTCLLLCRFCTVEFYINIHERRQALESGRVYKNPFNEGWRKNLMRVFGNDGMLFLRF